MFGELQEHFFGQTEILGAHFVRGRGTEIGACEAEEVLWRQQQTVFPLARNLRWVIA